LDYYEFPFGIKAKIVRFGAVLTTSGRQQSLL